VFVIILQVLDFLERGVASKQIKTVVMASGKKESFLAGADVVPVFPIADIKGLFCFCCCPFSAIH
jgi:enoyl-CoA hydratase/carnithine racemase